MEKVDPSAHVPAPRPHASHGLLAGRTVLVTAAAGTGIGFATARRCVQEGARVAISDRHERRLAESLADLSALAAELGGAPPVAVPCDVTREADVQRLFADTIAEFGHLDVVVNNAGLGGEVPLVDMTDEQWSAVLDVTLTGTFRCTRAALRHMLPRRSGAIVNNASVLGWRAQAGQAHYAAAKAGVIALTKSLALEVSARGVLVNAIAPGPIDTPMVEGITEDWKRAKRAELPLGRFGRPEEVAPTAVLLASDPGGNLYVGQTLGPNSGDVMP
jgi:3-oxoacyl-[acyl-carrier protein] reductase